ncbi:MAG: aminoglycoside phosphotransferase family protein [Pseudomonadota bacterium]
MIATAKPIGRLHADEIETDIGLARRLLAGQFPHWADLELTPVASTGTDNAIYRLGDEMCLRLPRRPSAVLLIEKECAWLPKLAPLPLQVPKVLGVGQPNEEYPWAWSVCSWIDGDPVKPGRPRDPAQAADAIAHFLRALQAIDTTGGPLSGSLNHNRGVPLAQLDVKTRRAIANLEDEIDTVQATALWADALAAPAWDRPPVWVHGDLQPSNLLANNGAICAVIDFGLLGVGDPACDLTISWSLLPKSARPAFRAALSVDDTTWRRGRGWSLYTGVIALDYYRDSNSALSNLCRHALGEVLSEWSDARQ